LPNCREKITAFQVNHEPVYPAVRYRFDYKGRSVVISGDTIKWPNVIRHAMNADLLDISETPDDWPDNNSAAAEDHQYRDCGRARPLTSRVEIHTLGGWMVTLKAVAMARSNVLDERQLFAHLLNVPAIPFRLEKGGIGLINPANITRVSAWPKPDALSGTALPLALRRCTPSLQRGGKRSLVPLFDHKSKR
jgi:hypothetical protein